MKLAFTYAPEDLQELAQLQFIRPDKWEALQRSLARWLLFIGLTLILITVVRLSKGAKRPAPTPAAPMDRTVNMAAPILASLCIVGFAALTVFARRKSRGRSAPDAGNEWRAPHAIQIDAEGVQLSSQSAPTRWPWTAFEAWRETATLFVLRQTDGRTFVAVPKCAVGSGPELDELRALLGEHIRPAVVGFSVDVAGNHAAPNRP